MRHGNRLPRSAVELATLYRRTAAQSGKRGWYCDRSGCKRSWSDADPIVASVISPDVGEHSVLSVAANLKQQPFVAARNGSAFELVQPGRNPVPVVAEGFTDARAAAPVGGAHNRSNQ